MKLKNSLVVSAIGEKGVGKTTFLCMLGELFYEAGLTNIKTHEIGSGKLVLPGPQMKVDAIVANQAIIGFDVEPVVLFVDGITTQEQYQTVRDKYNSLIFRVVKRGGKTADDEAWIYRVTTDGSVYSEQTLRNLQFSTKDLFLAHIPTLTTFKNSIQQ